MIDRTRHEEEHRDDQVDRTSGAQREHRKLGRFRTQERDETDGGQRPAGDHTPRGGVNKVPREPYDRERRAERIC